MGVLMILFPFLRAKAKVPVGESHRGVIFTGTGVELDSSSKEVNVSFLPLLIY